MNYKETIYKLQVGINGLKEHIGVDHDGQDIYAEIPFKVTFNQNQFYSSEKHKPIHIYSIKFVVYNEEKYKNDYIEVYKTGVQLFMVFFMRNLWYSLNGQSQKVIPQTQFPEFERSWQTFLGEFGEFLSWRDELQR